MLGSGRCAFQTRSSPSAGHPQATVPESAAPGHLVKTGSAAVHLPPAVPGCLARRASARSSVSRHAAAGLRFPLGWTAFPPGPGRVRQALCQPVGILAPVSGAAVSVCGRVPCGRGFRSLGCGPGSGLLGRTVTDGEESRCSSETVVPFTSPPAASEGSSFCVLSLVSVFLITAVLPGAKWHLTMVLVCIALMTGDVEHLFMCCCVVVFVEEMSVQSLAHLKNWVFAFLLS